MRGYSRAKFPHWRSTGENCDVRDTVLKRDGSNVKVRGCNVTTGRWTSVYDGKTFTSAAGMDVDHMVPLANAWRSGAADWTEDERGDFLEANEGMPDGHYAKFGGEDLPGYPEVWQERQIP